MIAKLTVHAPTRALALAALDRALRATQVAGTVTNLGFLQRLVRDPVFAAGTMDTGLIGRTPSLTAPAVADPARVAWAALGVAGVLDPAPWQGFALWQPMARQVTLGEDTVTLTAAPGGWDAGVAGQVVALRHDSNGWRADGMRMPAMHAGGDAVTVFGPDPLTLTVPDPLDRGGQGPGGDAVLAPMPGLVAQVTVTVGQVVTQGDRLIVLEAMKMEHALRAPRDGTVAQVTVAPGDQVKAGVALVTLVPLEDG